MKVGVNGAVRDISDLKVGANGAVRQASELWIGVNGAVKKVWPIIPVGYQVILDTVGEGVWECPATGEWEVEGHGGGCGGYPGTISEGGDGGGGSGEVFTIALSAGQEVAYLVASGGDGASAISSATPGSGGNTTFGELKFYGASSRSATGSLASGGGLGNYMTYGVGGKGNSNKPEQTYGNGGNGGRKRNGPGANPGADGKDGAIILTYLG